jgi:ferredoxin-type protein NapH
MYGRLFSNPTYLFAVLFLPLMALFLAPLFCGWMCPAGQITEFLSRLIPPRFQLDLSGKVNGVPVRYGFTLGMAGVALMGGNACCTFCNFTHTQNVISAVLGDFRGISYVASFSIVTFGLWFIMMGLFTKGGRGWCNFLCPAGALMGLFHWIGVKLKISWLVKIDQATCTGCAKCVKNCPAWAVARDKEKQISINRHACTACMDCARVCPVNAIHYGVPERLQA